jgi:hypothetical protein
LHALGNDGAVSQDLEAVTRAWRDAAQDLTISVVAPYYLVDMTGVVAAVVVAWIGSFGSQQDIVVADPCSPMQQSRADMGVPGILPDARVPPLCAGGGRPAPDVLRHADQVDLRRSGNVAVPGTARRPQIARSPVRRTQVSGPESACDGEVPPTAIARVTCPPARLGLGPPWDVGVGPWHVVPARAMIVIGWARVCA